MRHILQYVGVMIVVIIGILTIVGSGATNPSSNHSSNVKLRAAARAEVRSFAIETSQFLAKNGEEKTITAAKEQIGNLLKDPDSAKFKKIRIVDYDSGKVVCGEVNAKNGYGGYVGYKKVVAGVNGAYIENTEDHPRITKADNTRFALNAGLNGACGYQ